MAEAVFGETPSFNGTQTAQFDTVCSACTIKTLESLALALADMPEVDGIAKAVDAICVNLNSKWCYIE